MSEQRVGRRAVRLKVRHSVEASRAHFQGCTCAVERRRTQVVWWRLGQNAHYRGCPLAEGMARAEVLRLSAYSETSLWEIVKRYNEAGLAGLADRRHYNPGAPTLLSDPELLLLAQWVHQDYAQTATFEVVLKNFATTVAASTAKHVLLVLDNAPWHHSAAPEGIGLVYQPPYSSEVQPAEHL